MRRPRLTKLFGLVVAALLCTAAWGAAPPQPGTINYIEGQASIDGRVLNDTSVGSVKLDADQSLSTESGRVEILLTPGVFLRIGNNSVAQMISPGLANTVLTLQHGRALVEVADILPENNVVINEGAASTRLLKAGLYDFDADHGVIRVYDGKAAVQTSGRQLDVKGGHQLNLNETGKLKAQK